MLLKYTVLKLVLGLTLFSTATFASGSPEAYFMLSMVIFVPILIGFLLLVWMVIYFWRGSKNKTNNNDIE